MKYFTNNEIYSSYEEYIYYYSNNKIRTIDIQYNASLLGEALYIINKQAKKFRDVGNDISKNEMYKIKNILMEKLIYKYNMMPIGYHDFSYENEYTFSCNMYNIGGFEFHYNSDYDSENFLGTITQIIGSNPIKSNMPLERAIEIINDFLKNH